MTVSQQSCSSKLSFCPRGRLHAQNKSFKLPLLTWKDLECQWWIRYISRAHVIFCTENFKYIYRCTYCSSVPESSHDKCLWKNKYKNQASISDISWTHCPTSSHVWLKESFRAIHVILHPLNSVEIMNLWWSQKGKRFKLNKEKKRKKKGSIIQNFQFTTT